MSFQTIRFILGHPLSGKTPVASLARYLRWQATSRVFRIQTVEWIGGARLVVERGMTGATGNIYCGLHEFSDMAFLLHFLQPGDTFLDIGANVGSYTVLASGVRGATTIAFEPDPLSSERFMRNVSVNNLADKVALHRVALGARDGEAFFTSGRDTMNRMAAAGEAGSVAVPVKRLDSIAGAGDAVLIKMDVEGFEADVLAGAEAKLASPHLIAIITEGHDQEIVATLTRHGFARAFYDPFTRSLRAEAPAGGTSNALFIRKAEDVQRRLSAAPRIPVLGQSL